MADWKDIEQLQAEFKTAQLSSAAQKLSERNCIEILNKLQEMKLLDVLHSVDGKEYLTPTHLAKEIRDELYMQGGRINLVDLQQALNVDFSHVEAKSNELVKSDRNLQLIYGQMIDSTYLDRLAEEINENLQSTGQLTIAELSKQYDVPGDFLIPELISRIGKQIDGKLDEINRNAIFTEAYIAKHKARIRGVLSAVTRPIQLYPLSHDHGLSMQLLFSIVEELIKEGRIKGQIAGGRSEKSMFLPEIHTQTQNQWIDNFYAQNNYIEFDAVSRLGISDPKSYVRRRLTTNPPLFLKSVCVGQSIVDQIMATVDETIANGDWVDMMNFLPTSFLDEDCNQLLHHVMRERKKIKSSVPGIIFANSIVANEAFVNSCLKYFDGMMREKAEKDVKKSSVFALTEEERKEYLHQTTGDPKKKSEKKDDRRKKATEGSGSVKQGFEGASGSGKGAREVKTKGKDKKRLKWKKEHETQTETKPSKPSSSQDDLPFMDVGEITDVLHNRIRDCPPDFLQELSERIHRPLHTSYQAVVKSVFQISAQQSKEAGESGQDASAGGCAEKKSLAKSRKQSIEEISTMWANTRLFMEAIKLFEGDTAVQLEKHLLKTICLEITNSIFALVAIESVSGADANTEMTANVRIKMLSLFPDELKPSLTRLNSSVTGKDLHEFTEALQEATSPKTCDIFLRSADKKKDRQVMHGHKMSLLKQLENESNGAMALHLAVTIVFQSVTGCMIHTPGKCVPEVLGKIQPLVDKDVHRTLNRYQDLVMKEMITRKSSTPDNDHLAELQSDLINDLPVIQTIAATTKKQTT
uniref:E3 UFM1-protein ligase 1 n=1 Tax=Ciona intestinalis TaxID=7719 RepID=UPI0000523EB9|nr:E3 UFM1-protein ligase 1 [Ciona intestinalis]|eukprot:XP_002122241.1 E3 UFM1-protein ligase 1 [Ciona intestinalis]